MSSEEEETVHRNLLVAVEQGDTEDVQKCLREGAEVNYFSKEV